MNERELELTLKAIGQRHVRGSAPPRLRERIRAVSESSPRSGFLGGLSWRFQSMFSAAKLVVAAAIVALFGVFLLAGMLTQPSEEAGPGVGASELAEAEPSVESTTKSGSVPGSFGPAGSLAEGRQGHTATLLQDGRVLVIGGYGEERVISSAEVWDPATASFSPAGSLAEARGGHAAQLLPDGRVLVVGGEDDAGDGLGAEVWDPATASFSTVGPLADARPVAAVPLPDGRVIVIGSDGPFVWDPATASFSPTGSSGDARWDTLMPLPDGRVLVIGDDWPWSGNRVASIWDPVTEALGSPGPFSPTRARDAETATILPDGAVLVVGGHGGGGRVTDLAEIWDPTTASYRAAGSLAAARDSHTATLLSDGHVLIVGGFGGFGGPGSDPGSSTEVWDPTTETFSHAGSLSEPRAGHTATLLSDGRVLIVGGDATGSAEVWEPGEGAVAAAG